MYVVCSAFALSCWILGNEIRQSAAPGLGQDRVGEYLDIATSDRAPDDTALLAAADLESVKE